MSIQKIGEVSSGGSNVSSLTISSIPTTYNHLQIYIVAKGDQTNQTSNVALRFNGNAASGNTAWIETANGSIMRSDETNTTRLNLRSIGPINGYFKLIRIQTFFTGASRGGTYGRQFIAELSGCPDSTQGYVVGNWYDSAAVTSVTFLGTANAIGPNTKMVVYGVQ